MGESQIQKCSKDKAWTATIVPIPKDWGREPSDLGQGRRGIKIRTPGFKGRSCLLDSALEQYQVYCLAGKRGRRRENAAYCCTHSWHRVHAMNSPSHCRVLFRLALPCSCCFPSAGCELLWRRLASWRRVVVEIDVACCCHFLGFLCWRKIWAGSGSYLENWGGLNVRIENKQV